VTFHDETSRIGNSITVRGALHELTHRPSCGFLHRNAFDLGSLPERACLFVAQAWVMAT
jgi:hypothetical protein